MLLSIKGFSSGVQHSSRLPSPAPCPLSHSPVAIVVVCSSVGDIPCRLLAFSLPLSPTASDTDTTRHFRLCNDAGLRFVPLMSTMYAPHTHTLLLLLLIIMTLTMTMMMLTMAVAAAVALESLKLLAHREKSCVCR